MSALMFSDAESVYTPASKARSAARKLAGNGARGVQRR